MLKFSIGVAYPITLFQCTFYVETTWKPFYPCRTCGNGLLSMAFQIWHIPHIITMYHSCVWLNAQGSHSNNIWQMFDIDQVGTYTLWIAKSSNYIRFLQVL